MTRGITPKLHLLSTRENVYALKKVMSELCRVDEDYPFSRGTNISYFTFVDVKGICTFTNEKWCLDTLTKEL